MNQCISLLAGIWCIFPSSGAVSRSYSPDRVSFVLCVPSDYNTDLDVSLDRCIDLMHFCDSPLLPCLPPTFYLRCIGFFFSSSFFPLLFPKEPPDDIILKPSPARRHPQLASPAPPPICRPAHWLGLFATRSPASPSLPHAWAVPQGQSRTSPRTRWVKALSVRGLLKGQARPGLCGAEGRDFLLLSLSSCLGGREGGRQAVADRPAGREGCRG